MALLCAASMLANSNLAFAQSDAGVLEKCVVQNRSLSALFLVDTSTSLRTNDSENERVQAIQSALSALAALHSSPGVAVNVEFMDFSARTRRSFPERMEWATVPVFPDEQAAIASRFAERTDGGATDYVAALEPWVDAGQKPADEVGALEMLERAPEGSCRLLVWFTDGQLDIGYYGTPRTINWTDPPTVVNSQSLAVATRDAAIARLCMKGGLADRLRAGSDIASGSNSQVSIVALDKQGTLDFSLLRAFATGDGRDDGCGSRPARGTFGTAEDVGSVAIELREAVLGGTHGETGGTRSCLTSTDNCEDIGDEAQEYDYTFYLWPGFQRFNLLTLSSHPSVTTTLISPDGTSFGLRAGNQLLENQGVTLNVEELQLQNGAFLIDGSLDPSTSWTGHWRVRYSTVDPAAADALNRASIYVFGNLMMELDASQGALQAGLDNEIIFRIVGGSSEPATDTDLQSGTRMEVWVNEDVASAPIMQSDGTYMVSIVIPSALDEDTVTVKGLLEPVVQLAPEAPFVSLTPWTGTLGRVAVRPVGGYPLIKEPLGFGDGLNNTNQQLRTTMEVDASEPGAGGCVELLEITAPRIDSHALDMQVIDDGAPIQTGAECPILLVDGETGTLTVMIDGSTLESFEGQVVPGTLRLRASNPIDPSRSSDYAFTIRVPIGPPEELGVPIDAEVPRITETNWLKVMILLVVVLIFPVALLYGLRILTSRLIIGDLTSVEIPVAVSENSIHRLDDMQNHIPLRVEGRDIGSHLLAGGKKAKARSVDVGEATIRTSRSPLLRLPSSDASAQATVRDARDATLVVGSQGTASDGRTGKLRNSLSGEWLFHTSQPLQTPEMPASIDGSLTLIVSLEADASIVNDLLRERAEAIAQQITSAANGLTIAADEPTSAEPDSGEGAAGLINETEESSSGKPIEEESSSGKPIETEISSIPDTAEDDW